MAKNELVMPQMGESITTGTITKWNKAVGDTVEIDDIILEISTDKVESEIPSPFSGKVVELLFEEGETIDVGKVIAYIDDDANAEVTTSSSEQKASPKEQVATTEQKTEVAHKASASKDSQDKRFYTPLVRKLASDAGVDLAELKDIDGSGAGGRVNKNDFESFLASRGSEPKVQASKTSQSSTQKSTPAASSPSFNSTDRVEVIPMDNMRKAIAKNMVISKQTSPHVNSVLEVDMTHLVKFREAYKGTFQKNEGFKLTYTPFIMRAIIMALKEHPYVNASVDGDNIVLKKDINLGCAVAVPGNGLVVPVIKGADNLNMTGLCRSINDLANRARAKKLGMDDLTGGTFTFTNVGSFQTLLATPVILQPQVGILAAGVIEKRVKVMKDDAIAIRSMMYLTHSYDHRLVDGELGGRFLLSVKNNLEQMSPDDLF
jgi:2-oxoglutarate dehydrogenase E2 component (dihydrolipoamide succinyltransferase)